jgi:CheY-like chemotaxis protein
MNSDPSRAGTRMRVLVVEDNADVAAMLADVLDHLGCSVEVAVDGTEGLRAAAESPPALVLCDIGLPDIDGYEVAQRLRTAGYDGLLVAVTGYGGVKDRERAVAAGFDDHFTKPVSIDELRGIVADAEGRYAQRPPPAARSHLP